MAFEALKKARESHDSIDFYRHHGIKCPHCGYLHDEATEWPYEEGGHDYECSLCGQDFVVVVHIQYSWDTSDADDG